MEDIQEVMDGTSLRPKSAAARVWGCLAALRQDERSIGNSTLTNALGWSDCRASGGGERGGVSNSENSRPAGKSIRADALRVAREGTLMNSVLNGLQTVAEGGVLAVVDADEASGSQRSDKGKSALPREFARSALACLEVCGRADRALRVPHSQMATVLEALFRGGHGVAVETGCVSLALALADKDQIYSTWLRDRLRGSIFMNLARETRQHFVSAFDRLALKLPSGIVSTVVEDVWGALSPEVFVDGTDSAARRSSTKREGESVHGSETHVFAVDLVSLFLSSLRKAILAERGEASKDPTSPAAVRESITGVVVTVILPSCIAGYAGRGYHDVSFLDRSAPDYALWDALVGLLCCLPQHRVADVIDFKLGAETCAAAAASTPPTDRTGQAIKAYLTVRLAAANQYFSISEDEKAQLSKRSSSEAAVRLGHVARWATRKGNDRRTSTVLLPHLAEGLKRVNSTSVEAVSSEWKAGWLRTQLDTAGLPEMCPLKILALLGAAAVAWEPPSNLALLAMGETASHGPGDRRSKTDSAADQGEIGIVDASLSVSLRQGAWAGPGSRLIALGVSAPKVVTNAEKRSNDVSTEVLARLLRVPGMLRDKRSEGIEVTDKDGDCQQGATLGELEEVRLGVDRFIEGLKHSPAILSGRMSRQFSAHASSVAAERALGVLTRVLDSAGTDAL